MVIRSVSPGADVSAPAAARHAPMWKMPRPNEVARGLFFMHKNDDRSLRSGRLC